MPPADQERQAEHDDAEAVRLLDRARAAGFYKDPAQVEKLKTDADLALLRARDDFQKVLKQVAGV